MSQVVHRRRVGDTRTVLAVTLQQANESGVLAAVDLTGLTVDAHLPEAVRLIMVKADGCVAVHADGGAYKPLNWMNAPNRLVEEPSLDDSEQRWKVTNEKGEQLIITMEELSLQTQTLESVMQNELQPFVQPKMIMIVQW